MTFVHLPFSVGSLDLYHASLVFMKGTSCCVLGRKFKQSRAVRLCYGKFEEVIGLHDLRCYLHVASLRSQAGQTLFVIYIRDSIALRFEPVKRMYENGSKIALNSTCSKGFK